MRNVIEIEGVTKRFGSVTAVDEVSLSIRENEFFGLLGPSGCGKTTLLRMLAGFETPDAGRLLLDGRDLVGVKPYRRPVNMMFQSYALFPHMTVERNVSYGLERKGVAKAEREVRVREILGLVGLADRARHRPRQLSGGQQQRVALARALVNNPRVLLLDEPLSALDRQIRSEMQIELKRLQHDLGITFVVVTHDQEEALAMADRIAVMDLGTVVQTGAPEDLYESPGSAFVARFLGDSNLFGGVVERAGADTLLVDGERRWRVEPKAVERLGLAGGAEATAVLRPERMRVAAVAEAGSLPVGANVVEGTVAEVVYLGADRKIVVDLPGGGSARVRVDAVDPGGATLAPGATVLVAWSAADATVVAGRS